MAAAAILHLFFGYIPVTNEDNCVKFGRLTDIENTRFTFTVAQHPRSLKFKMATDAILNLRIRPYLGRQCKYLRKNCTWRNTAPEALLWCIVSVFVKFKMAAAAMLELCK